MTPSQRRSRLRQPQNNQTSAATAIADKISAARLTSSNSLLLRALVGTVPIQLSRGVRSQNIANTAMVSGARDPPELPPRRPTAVPVINGTSRMPHAPCSRGKTSDRCRPGVPLMSPSWTNREVYIVTSVTQIQATQGTLNEQEAYGKSTPRRAGHHLVYGLFRRVGIDRR